MPRKRADSFKIALETLRDELRRGRHAPGARLTANDIAERLSLSQTPVREALSRLTGEGLLLDRRGQGFFVPALGEHDLIDLFHMQLEVLLIACSGEAILSAADVERLRARGANAGAPEDLPLASERLLRAFTATSSPTLARHLGRLHDQLASVRASEPQVLEDLAEELETLSSTLMAGDVHAIRDVLTGFFERRMKAAPLLAKRQEASANIVPI